MGLLADSKHEDYLQELTEMLTLRHNTLALSLILSSHSL